VELGVLPILPILQTMVKKEIRAAFADQTTVYIHAALLSREGDNDFAALKSLGARKGPDRSRGSIREMADLVWAATPA
jgi:hypothetical protein